MLTRMVDGIEVALSAQEEADVLAEWAANTAAAQLPQPLSADEKLDKLLHYIAQQPGTPPDIKALNGQ